MKKTTLISMIIIIISFVLAIYLYPRMPDWIASHWNAQGEVDDYLPKFWGMFMMPLVSLGMFLLLIWIPNLDPLKNNVKKFRKYYDGFILLMVSFMTYIYLLTLAWSMEYKFDMGIMIMPAMAILFYYMGLLIENAKRNWFIGIRTPWTLSNDKVWEKTHKLGGKLFKILGVIALIGMFFGKNSMWFILIPVLSVAVYLIAYSYFEYKKLRKKDKK